MSEKDTETDTETDEGTETEAETDMDDETETAIGESVRNGSDERTEASDGQTATVADVEALRGDVVAFAEDVEDRIMNARRSKTNSKRMYESASAAATPAVGDRISFSSTEL